MITKVTFEIEWNLSPRERRDKILELYKKGYEEKVEVDLDEVEEMLEPHIQIFATDSNEKFDWTISSSLSALIEDVIFDAVCDLEADGLLNLIEKGNDEVYWQYNPDKADWEVDTLVSGPNRILN